MKKTLAILPLVAALAACGTTNTYDKRAEIDHERKVKYAERAIDKAPKWMTELPTSQNAVYANGTSVSSDFSMSRTKARTVAFAKICMAAGGRVDQQTRMFLQDTENAGTETSETAIRSMCPSVDITGVETVEVKTIAEGPRFRSYVLVALPSGDANRFQARKDQIDQRNRSQARQADAFREMDQNSQPR